MEATHITDPKKLETLLALMAVATAANQVGRAEQKTWPEVRRTGYVWHTNEANLSHAQRDALGERSGLDLRTVQAHQIRLTFQHFYAQPFNLGAIIDMIAEKLAPDGPLETARNRE